MTNNCDLMVIFSVHLKQNVYVRAQGRFVLSHSYYHIYAAIHYIMPGGLSMIIYQEQEWDNFKTLNTVYVHIIPNTFNFLFNIYIFVSLCLLSRKV